jgi:hypothetical protein
MNISYFQARAMVDIDSISDILKLKYPEISEDMTSWKFNEGCECGKKFLDFLNKKYLDEQNKIFLDTILNNTDLIKKTEEIIKTRAESYKKRNFSGKIIKIDKSPESWEELSNTLQNNNAIFKSFFITDLGDLLEIRFL